MKQTILVNILNFLLLSVSWNMQAQTPKSKHVILIGLDGMGAYGFQRAHTPFMNEMVKNGALNIKARCVLESSSSQNWMTMLSGAIPIQHGVTSNNWEPGNHVIEPTIRNRKGFFPSIFDNIKAQRPEAKVFMFYQWTGLGRMFDLTVPDKVVHIKNGEKIMIDATEAFFKERPEFLFIDIDETDHAGHVYGHESQGYFDCITKYDALIGKLTERLKQDNLLENTVIIITGDHGGLSHGHGGESPYEMEIPILMYGSSVTRGKLIEQGNIIADIAPTVAGLLGVSMPDECVGKFIYSAFEQKSNLQYAPIPVITPLSGFYHGSVELKMKADYPDAKIHYTLDSSEPSVHSILYEKPIIVSKSTTVKTVTIVGKSKSRIEVSALRIAETSGIPAVHYKFYENYADSRIPDFNLMHNPAKEGFVYEFSLQELNIVDKDHFAIEFESQLTIDQPGSYLFTLASDDGAKLYIDNDLVIDNDGSHSLKTKKGKIDLKKGNHQIRIEYFDDSDTEYLDLSYESELVSNQIVPFAKLKR